MAAKHVGLGKGLSALIKDTSLPSAEAVPAPPAGNVTRVPLNQVRRNPWQPRRHFDADALAELVNSVREHGVLQPLLVRPVADGYQLIAGERRLRAAQEAELDLLPVIIMEVADQEAAEITLIENLQREDLNPIEEAEGYESLASQFNMTQEQIAERVGKARATVANVLRLLTLPAAVRTAVARNQLSSGHAKVLLGLAIPEEQELLAERVVKEGLSVRALERIVERRKKPPRRTAATRADIPADHVHYLTDQLHHVLGTSVRLRSCRTMASGRTAPGTIEIDYYSRDDLDRLLHVFGVGAGEPL